ncbi:MAG TPA: DnaB-like helicase C-terminal domain-containing protein [Allosphingosinicella sp.]|nr:DnaB-like helicase C-terminal domain-containing protein [Allosphingosinicella sp.]
MNQPFAPDHAETQIANAESEMGLVAAMLFEPRIVDAVADMLTPSDFWDPLLGRMFDTIVREHSLGRALNPITLRPFFKDDPAFEELGGIGWMIDPANSVSVIGARDFAWHIAELASRRRFVDGLRVASSSATDLNKSLAAIAGEAEEAIAAATGERSDAHEKSAAQCLDMVIEGFDEPLGGVLCGVIPAIDSLLGPIRPSHLIIGAGRPSMGKTATAISYALGAAERGHGVVFVSLEMSAEQLAERMAADLCLDKRIPYESIRDRKLDTLQRREVCRARDRIAEMPLEVIDRSAMTIGQLRTVVRRWRRRFAARGVKLELLILDYLQLMSGDRKMDRIQVVSEVSRGLKEIAKENGIGVLALSQLSRKVEERSDKRPMMSDLRESGQIEQDADAVLFFLRDEYYLRQTGEPTFGDPGYEDWQKKLDACRGRIEFIVAKKRHGTTGSKIGDFLGHFQAVRG